MNVNQLAKLPNATPSQGKYASISRLDGKLSWEFLVMPLEITWSRSSNFATADNPVFPTPQYKSTEGWTLTFNDIPLLTTRANKNLTDYVNQLSSLELPDPAKLSPPALLFKWGQRILSPCRMTRFAKKETDWNSDGELQGCNVSFTLIQVSDKIIVN